MGGSLTATTVNRNELVTAASPSLTVMLIVQAPLWFVEGVIVKVRLEPAPPKTMFATATRFVSELSAPRLNEDAGVSASPIVKAIGPMGVSSSVVSFVKLDIVGKEL